MAAKKNKQLDNPSYYINRELSWLEFNRRVLALGQSPDLPLLERLKFLAIVSSNLDEFFMIRVGGLMQRRSAGIRRKDISGLTTLQQLKHISKKVHTIVTEQSLAIEDVLTQLKENHLSILHLSECTSAQQHFLEMYFINEIMPTLTPIGVSRNPNAPIVPGLQMNIALLIADPKSDQQKTQLCIIPIPDLFARFVNIPCKKGICVIPLEEIVTAYIQRLVPNQQIISRTVIRITRDADVEIQEDEAGDLLFTIEKAVLSRRRQSAVRLEIDANTSAPLKNRLIEWLGIETQDVYEIEAVMNAAKLMEIYSYSGFDKLKYPDWPIQPPAELIGKDDLWEAIRQKDILLYHPYERFDAVVELIKEAAEDPNVLAIKQTLYRTSGDSPIIRALENAARNGKQVTVLIELKARFDEANNIQWARRLEEAGCYVIYGIAGYKTHAKALLIVRRETAQLRRYVHLSTGNYNDKTVKLYSDIGLLTCDPDITLDVAAVFNVLTGHSDIVPLSELTIAPSNLKQRFIDLIERELQASSPDRPGLIMAKMNSLEDKAICQALYKASQAGVQIQLNIRGICCLRPGMKGLSKNIEVCSIIDRYLEHARIFYFRNGGHEEVYMSSADWMRRNLDKRLEILFPVKDETLKNRIKRALQIYFKDNQFSWQLNSDGSYTPRKRKGKAVRAQQALYEQSAKNASLAEKAPTRFQPMTRPNE